MAKKLIHLFEVAQILSRVAETPLTNPQYDNSATLNQPPKTKSPPKNTSSSLKKRNHFSH